ncbi:MULTISPECIES: radical SAM protein [unclassified Massilia]|uniref:B12-binding domain-containing radical SAM protein n=1 Tax=unclassified Massilia TaxID=2609279 RepID=UPI001782D986|nr:radical SAM protein [Massilia sp. CFBP 13647]MBD8671993.1 radical SAM protein [Massilia sp. CFBP 13721]
MQTHLITWARPRLRTTPAATGAAGAAIRRRIVLVDLYWTRDKDPRVPLGHASLLATLRSDPAIEARSVVLAVNEQIPVAAIARRILAEAAGLDDDRIDIAVGAYVWNEGIVQELLPLLRFAGFAGRIILGGPQVSYVDTGLERLYPDADLFIRGHAETALLEAVRSAGRTAIRGVHYAGTLDRNEQASAPLEGLPSPLIERLIGPAQQDFLRWETRRGCQFKCSFCQHRQKDAQAPRETFPATRLFDEIDLICRAGVRELAVLDPVFNTNEDEGHAVRVLERFAANGYRGRISLQCRAELVDAAFLAVARRLDVCLEFGLQTIHKNEQRAIERINSLDKVDAALAHVRALEIDHEVSLIFGLPEQTLDAFIASVGWCLERRVPVIKAFPLLLLRGTKMDLERARWGLVVEGATMPQVVASNTFTRAEWQKMNAISQALRETEGAHPPLQALLALADAVGLDPARWQPGLAGEAA